MKYFRIAVFCLLVIISTHTFATRPRQFPFLNFASFVYFHGNDLRFMLSALDQALNHSPDKSKVFWRNPATCEWGTIEVDNTSCTSGPECRDVTIVNRAAYNVDINFFRPEWVNGEVSYRVCKIRDTWRLSQE